MIHPGNLHWTWDGYVDNALDCCGGWCSASVICNPLLAQRSRIASERSQGKCGSRQRVEKKTILTEKKFQNKMSRERDTKDKMFQDLSSEPDAKRTKGPRASELSRGAAESKNVPGGEASTEKVSNRRRCQGNKMARKLKQAALASFL